MRRVAGLIALIACGLQPHGVVAQTSQPPPVQAAPKPAQIDRNGVLILIRSALIAVDQGNKTGNYTVLRDLGAPGFQTNTAARLAEIFVAQRRDNIDLSGVAVLDPQLTILPQIESNGMLRMAGFFPSVPTQVNFDLMYAPVNGQWRLFGISVNLGQAAPAAPSAPAPAAETRPAPAQKQAPSAAVKPAPPPPESAASQKQPAQNGAKAPVPNGAKQP